ncbi:MAG: hypothetical protein ICV84_01615, partial [Flavisolibacter sp.]|nr:hypothetical protein [Flavisolibacter sp.]
NIVFPNGPLFSDQFDVYIKEDSGWIHETNGFLVPWSKRSGFKMVEAIPVTIPALEEKIIYLRTRINLHYRKPQELQLKAEPTQAFIKEHYVENEAFLFTRIRTAFLFGVLFFCGIMNIFFFSIVRERVYLYYALFVLFYGLNNASHNIALIFFKEHWDFAFIWGWSSNYLYFFFLVQFIRHFLKTPVNYPKWDRYLFSLGILQAIMGIPAFFIEPSLSGKWNGLTTDVTYLLWGLIHLSILTTFFYFIREQNKSIRLLIIAALPAFCIWGLEYIVVEAYNILNFRLNVPFPQFIRWLHTWNVVLQLICVCWFVIIFAWILFQRYSMLRKQLIQQALEREMERMTLINKQKEELEEQVLERTSELKQSLNELKSTQVQLIQKEKMASLGEITAGIAHEIQNPLNFINNFSEVSFEMMDEVKQGINTGNSSEALDIADAVKDNLQKITHYGKRADSIVKRMLEHSRSDAAGKEPTDINALAEECLKLTYHAWRAKDQPFIATLQTQFDTSIGKVNVVAQDISRVLLNLLNNAFYAVSEKRKKLDSGYEPVVLIGTKRLEGKIEIWVRDNGIGIPRELLGKIYQPFFTTKPIGEGVGLGLSLSYDIIAKGHGGEMKVDMKEGEYTEFVMQLPV